MTCYTRFYTNILIEKWYALERDPRGRRYIDGVRIYPRVGRPCLLQGISHLMAYATHIRVYPLVCVFPCDPSSYTIPLRYLTSACTFTPGAYFLNHPPPGVLLLVCICFLVCIFASLYVFASLCVSASSCIFTSLCVSVSLYRSTSSYIFTSLCVSCRYVCVLYVQKN